MLADKSEDEDDRTREELIVKKQHPHRLHTEIWFNDPGKVC